MKSSPIDYWIALRIRLGPDAVWLAYEDSSGYRQAAPRALSGTQAGWNRRSIAPHLLLPPPGLTQQWAATDVLLPADFDDRIRAMLERAPAIRYGPHTTGPVPLAIYVAAPAGAQLLEWEPVVSSILPPDVDQDRIQLVRLARERWKARPAYTLPIRLLGVGQEASRDLERLRGSSWYRESEEVQQFGLQVDEVELTELPAALRSLTYDIVLVNEAGIEPVLQTTRQLQKPEQSRPRLVVYLDRSANRLYFSSLDLPPGVSLLWAPLYPASDSSELVTELMLALIHDYPLHEAVKSLTRRIAHTGMGPPVLVADPLSNHDLRLADALDQLRGDAFTVGSLIGSGDIDNFLSRIDQVAREPVARYLRAAREHETGIAKALELSHRAEFDFGQETFGLAPMASAEAAITYARKARDAMSASLEAIAADPELSSQVEAVQERRAEITMDRLDANAVYRPFDPGFDALRVSDIYRLNLHVGHRLPNSLFESEPPPLDPLLPEPEGESGHLLEVAVFEKDFELLSPRVQTLYLPRLGGSEPVKIECRAPAEPGLAELRISIYYQNYLLQSFLMTAQVLDQYSLYGTDRQISMQLDFSRTARFTNLPALGPRLLSIGSNQDADGRTHSFLLKKDEAATQPIKMTEAQATGQINRFRTLIETAATDIAHFAPKLDAGPPDDEERRAFDAVIRDLAELGRELYRFIFDNSPSDMKKQLRQVSKVSDEIIQITRHDPAFAFPWPAIYDFPLPKKVVAAPPARVCLGTPLLDPQHAAPGRGCPHNPDEEVYCVEGFWGIRHRLEQLIAQGDALRDAVGQIQRLPDRPGVCLATGVADPSATALTNLLQQTLEEDLCILRTQQEFIERLWQPENRPAVFILLSHLELSNKPGEPEGPRMLLSPHAAGVAAIPLDAWLQPGDITDQTIERGEWEEQPRTLVMLMACNGAASDVDTLNNYLTSLTSVGAGAIVGTETSVFSDLVSLFAKEVTLSLWEKDASLGEAIQSFNRRMITSCNPLAFVFNCFGSASLKLAATLEDT
jgi:hypothetical protein